MRKPWGAEQLLYLNLNRLWLDGLSLGHAQGQYAALQLGIDLVGVDVFRQFEGAAELAVTNFTAQRVNLLVGGNSRGDSLAAEFHSVALGLDVQFVGFEAGR